MSDFSQPGYSDFDTASSILISLQEDEIAMIF